MVTAWSQRGHGSGRGPAARPVPSFYRRRGQYLQNILFGFIFMPDAKRNAAIYYIEDGFDPKKAWTAAALLKAILEESFLSQTS